MLDGKISNILEKLDVHLTTLELRCKFCERPHNFEQKIELRSSGKEKINEIKTLKEKAENNKDNLLLHLLESGDKFSKLLTDLEYEKHDALNDIAVLESKLTKIEISPKRIDRIENSVLLS